MTSASKVELAHCESCPLKDSTLVPGEGPTTPDVVLVGEAPGIEEVRQGRPFVGRSGQILRSVLQQLDLRSVYITNTVLCYCAGQPPRNAVACCSERLINEIVSHQPRVVVPAGAVALQALTGDVGITEVQGLMFDFVVGDKTYKLIPTFHPAALLRRPDLFEDFVSALNKVKLYLQGTKFIDVQPDDLPVKVATTRGKAVAYLKQIRQHSIVACDLETTGYSPHLDTILCISLATESDEPPGVRGYVFPWQVVCSDYPYQLLKGLLEENHIVYHNGQFDVQFLRKAGINARICGDTLLMHYTQDERPLQQSLKSIARKLCNAPNWKEPLREWVASAVEGSFEVIPDEALFKYAALDACYTLLVYKLLDEQMDHDSHRLCQTILIPVSNVLADIALTGIRVDVERLELLKRDYLKQLEELERSLVEVSGLADFNPRSVNDCRYLLYEKLGLKYLPGAAGSTNREVLEFYQHIPEVALLRKFRELQKVYSTYLVGLSDFIIGGRIYPNLRLFGTVTGRLSCSNPNLLGLPKEKGGIRSLFVADEGKLLCYLDFKQMELRVAAALSGDENMKRSFVEGRDFHQEARERLFGKKEHYTHQEVLDAKMIVFGPLYGRGAPSLSRQLGCSIQEAEAYLEKLFKPFPTLLKWLESNVEEAISKGEISTLFGRKRRWGLITEETLESIECEARNFPVQATASDLNLLTMLEIYKTFRHDKVMPLLPIHDALLLSVDEAEVNSILPHLVEVASKTPQKWLGTDVPFEVDVSLGRCWT